MWHYHPEAGETRSSGSHLYSSKSSFTQRSGWNPSSGVAHPGPPCADGCCIQKAELSIEWHQAVMAREIPCLEARRYTEAMGRVMPADDGEGAWGTWRHELVTQNAFLVAFVDSSPTFCFLLLALSISGVPCCPISLHIIVLFPVAYIFYFQLCNKLSQSWDDLGT